MFRPAKYIITNWSIYNVITSHYCLIFMENVVDMNAYLEQYLMITLTVKFRVSSC